MKKPRGNNRGPSKPLSYSDILSKPVKEMDLPKVSMGVTVRKGVPKSCVLLLEPDPKSDKMSNNYFLGIKSKIKSQRE